MNTTHLLEFLAALGSGKHILLPYFTASFVQMGEKFQNCIQKQFSGLIFTLVYKTDCFDTQGIGDALKSPRCLSILFAWRK